MIGAISVSGWRSRALWGIALIFALAGVLYWTGVAYKSLDVVFRMAWALVPILSVLIARLVTGGRMPIEKPIKLIDTPKPEVNLALTADYLNHLVSGTTELEARRKISGLTNQIAVLSGEVSDVSENWKGDIAADVIRLQPPTSYGYYRPVTVTFNKKHSASLEAIKPGDWIKFQGEVAHSGVSGWQIVRGDFISRASPPDDPAPKTSRPSRRTSATKGS